MLKSKRGSHVGVILSFVIFIVFLIFLFSALQPALKIEKDKEATLEYITNSIIELSSDNITIENVVVDNNNEDCVQISKTESGVNILVKNSNEGIIRYSLTDKITIPISGKGNILLKIYYSKSINQSDSPVVMCQKINDKYTVGFVNKETVVFISKFNESANRDYGLLKKDLGISEGTEFRFSLLDASKTGIVEMKAKDISANVYVNEFPVLYSDKNGEIKSGFINVRVW